MSLQDDVAAQIASWFEEFKNIREEDARLFNAMGNEKEFGLSNQLVVLSLGISGIAPTLLSSAENVPAWAANYSFLLFIPLLGALIELLYQNRLRKQIMDFADSRMKLVTSLSNSLQSAIPKKPLASQEQFDTWRNSNEEIITLKLIGIKRVRPNRWSHILSFICISLGVVGVMVIMTSVLKPSIFF